MLTQEDIEFIQLLIDERIAASNNSKPKARKLKDYHTVYDIRDLIRQHLAEFRQWVGQETFQIALLRHFLANHTTMRPLDQEQMTTGSHGGAISKFDQQVANAI